MKQIASSLLLALAGLLAGGSALAVELKVLSAGAFKPVVMAALPEFERLTGHKVVVENDTAGALARRVRAGERFDLLVLPQGGLRDITTEGALAASGQQALARVAIGVAVRNGAPLPDISTSAAFRSALPAARNVAYIDPAAGGSSGIYLSGLFERMGIADQVRPKAVLVPGGLVAQRLLTGEADFAVHRISEILAVPGVTLVGPIPAEVQNYTVHAAALSSRTTEPAAAQQLLTALASMQVRAQLAKQGMEAA